MRIRIAKGAAFAVVSPAVGSEKYPTHMHKPMFFPKPPLADDRLPVPFKTTAVVLVLLAGVEAYSQGLSAMAPSLFGPAQWGEGLVWGMRAIFLLAVLFALLFWVVDHPGAEQLSDVLARAIAGIAAAVACSALIGLLYAAWLLGYSLVAAG